MITGPENAQDSSSYQGLIDWNAERAAGIVVGIEKATQGTGYTSAVFAENWRRMKAAGLLRGAYHYADAGDPIAQVNHFLAVVGPLDPTDRLWLDIEAADGPAWAYQFMVELERRTGGDPTRIGVYTGRWYIDQTGGPAAWQALTRWAYWYSGYTASPPSPAQLAPWGRCVLWQNTSTAHINGVQGAVDASIIQDGGWFAAHNIGPTPPPVPPPAPPIQGEEDPMLCIRNNAGGIVWVSSNPPQPIGLTGGTGGSWEAILAAYAYHAAHPSEPLVVTNDALYDSIVGAHS